MQEWLSADGFAADANGTTDFFENIKWSIDSDEDILKDMDTIDTILLGANTYRLFVNYWPEADPQKEIIANRLNETRKLVFSSSLENANWGTWESPELVKADAIATIKKLKNEPGKNMILWGSISLAQSLLAARLIDEIEIRTLPILLGTGRPLFKESPATKLATLVVKKYESGISLVRYEVIRETGSSTSWSL